MIAGSPEGVEAGAEELRRAGLATPPTPRKPGGGVMITLDRPIRWYTDAGHLDPFHVTVAT